MKGFIDVTGIDLIEAVKAAYDLSAPVGLGHVSAYVAGADGLTNEEAAAHVDSDSSVPISLDYVNGRCCKFYVFSRKGRLWTPRVWEYHSRKQLVALLRRAGR